MVLSMRESRGILGSSKVTEKFWSFEQDVDIFSHLGATLGTSLRWHSVFVSPSDLRGAPGGAGKSPAANGALMEGAAPGVPFPCSSGWKANPV